MKVEVLEKAKKRYEIIKEALNNYNSKKYELVINKLEELEEDLKPWDDPYLLGHVYALLCNSYFSKDFYNEEKIVNYSNKILLLSGQSLFEYTGNYSVFGQNNIDKLFAVYDRLISCKKDYAFWGKARLLAFQKKYGDSESLLKDAIKINNKNVYTYLMYGRLFEFQYKYEQAIEQFENALKIPSNNETSLTYQMLAYIYQKKTEYKKAEELFLKAIAINKEDSRAPMRISFLYYLNENEKWKETIDNALKISPDNSKVITAKADFIVTRNLKKANTLYDEAIAVNPLCNMAIRNKALYDNNFMNWNAVYKNCIRQNRFDTLSYVYYIRKLYVENKQYSKYCLSIINNILKKYCPFAKYEINYLKLYINNKNFDFFVNTEKILLEDKYNLDLHLLIADSYKENQDFENAKKYLLYASKIDKYNYTVFFELGYIEQQLRNYKKSIEYFKKSLELLKVTKTEVYLLISSCYLQECTENEERTNIEKEIKSIIENNKTITNWDYLLLGELAFRFDLYSEALSIFKKIDKTSLEYVLSIFLKCGIYEKKKNQKLLSKTIKEAIELKCYKYYDSLSELIDMFRDEIGINVFKELFVDNSEYKDNDFEKIVESEEVRKNKDIRELWFWISTIRDLLCYKKYNKENSSISHYTGTDTLDAICLYTNNNSNPLENDKENFKGKIRLSTITPANDPEEGNILSKVLSNLINGTVPTNKGSKKFAVLQTSLTLCEDSLTMLRFYGKKDYVEGSGVNIVFKNSYFVDNVTSSIRTNDKFISNNDENTSISSNKTEKIDIEKKCLYWILYFDSKSNFLIFNPISKYQAQIIDLNKESKDWKLIKPPLSNSDKALNAYYNLVGDNIKFSINQMVKTINTIIASNDKKNIKTIDDLLFYIKYLFKDEAFSDEQELRLMTISSMGNSTMLDFHRKIYENYVPISENGYNYIKKIIFGPNAKDCDITVEYYRHVAAISNKNIEIYKSHAPFSIVNNQGVECKK
ncbi:MAG: hypothetical protein K5829_07620 [Treponema sp.]|nr:hypothetical protein [Treponema sp.]